MGAIYVSERFRSATVSPPIALPVSPREPFEVCLDTLFETATVVSSGVTDEI